MVYNHNQHIFHLTSLGATQCDNPTDLSRSLNPILQQYYLIATQLQHWMNILKWKPLSAHMIRSDQLLRMHKFLRSWWSMCWLYRPESSLTSTSPPWIYVKSAVEDRVAQLDIFPWFVSSTFMNAAIIRRTLKLSYCPGYMHVLARGPARLAELAARATRLMTASSSYLDAVLLGCILHLHTYVLLLAC